jgi:pyruvyltransferase
MIDLTIPAYWHRSQNFGDQLTPYIIEKMTGRKVVYVEQMSQEMPTLMVTGSILSSPVFNSEIWGNGFAWYHEEVRKPLKVHAVRGPLTRDKLLKGGVECPDVYGDPGLLLPRIYTPNPSTSECGLGIIPHMIDYEKVKQEYPDDMVIDLKDPIEKVIDQISICRMVISSSLHGLVVAHAYGIPALWVEFSNNVIGDGFKFHDYLASVGMRNYAPLNLKRPKPSYEIIPHIPQDKININLDRLWNACPVLHLKKQL